MNFSLVLGHLSNQIYTKIAVEPFSTSFTWVRRQFQEPHRACYLIESSPKLRCPENFSSFRSHVSNPGQTHAAAFPSAGPYLNSSSVRSFAFLLSQNSQEKVCKSGIYQNALRTSQDYYQTANFPALQ